MALLCLPAVNKLPRCPFNDTPYSSLNVGITVVLALLTALNYRNAPSGACVFAQLARIRALGDSVHALRYFCVIVSGILAGFGAS